ncbi:MAG TPA: hypothetical protein P5543_08530, partial [Planctomycetota bacterium]|nr:hypothetical protein [Planctomycetota bacterium]
MLGGESCSGKRKLAREKENLLGGGFGFAMGKWQLLWKDALGNYSGELPGGGKVAMGKWQLLGGV